MLSAVVAALAGCASTTPPVAPERDPVDAVIAANAQAATQALRELSETTGNSRVVTTARPAAKPAAAAAAPAAAPAATPPAAAAPAPTTIAGRSGAIAVEVPATNVITPPSTGVVASGGLLSVPPAGLEKLVTVRWTGELEQLLAKVSQEVGWAMGEPSGLRVAPVIISISAENRSAFDVLRDIGAIAGTSADIHVSVATRTISVRYPQR